MARRKIEYPAHYDMRDVARGIRQLEADIGGLFNSLVDIRRIGFDSRSRQKIDKSVKSAAGSIIKVLKNGIKEMQHLRKLKGSRVV